MALPTKEELDVVIALLACIEEVPQAVLILDPRPLQDCIKKLTKAVKALPAPSGG